MKLEKMSVWDRLEYALHTKLYRFQVRGVRFAEKNEGRVLIGDDMGLGKTIQSIGWMAIRPEVRPVIVVCPAAVKYGWQAELLQHAGLKSYVCEGEMPNAVTLTKSMNASLAKVRKRKFKRTKLRTAAHYRRQAIQRVKEHRAKRMEMIQKKHQTIKRQDIIIVNFDILKDWLPIFLKLEPQLLIVDECQKISTRTTIQTKACLKLGRLCPHILALSGTPITGKPVQFYPVLHLLRPKEFPSFWKFAFAYCGPTKSPWGHGWDFNGATDLKGLHKRVKRIMIRRMKTEVMKNLPPKIRSVIPVTISNRAEYSQAKEEFLEWLRRNGGERAVKRAMGAIALVRLGKLKQLAAEGKMIHMRQWIEDFLKATNEKLIIFGIHKSVLRGMFNFFTKESIIIDGSTPNKKRKLLVRRFQKTKKCRLFFGQMKACGVGLDGLQVASNVLFLELGWTFAEHNQAEDRALRIGQESNSVNVYYMIGRNTVEESVIDVIKTKRGICKEVLDGDSTFYSLMKGL